MYIKLIVRNVLRNLQTYGIYFLSLSVIYSLLYAFNALPNHPVMQSLSGAKQMLTTIFSQYMGLLSYLVLGFVTFLVIYSTYFVLGRRKKELGLYASLGMRKSHIISILFCETLLVNVLALVVGLLVGLAILVLLAKIASDFFMGNYFGNLFFWDIPSVILLIISYFVISLIVGGLEVQTFKKKSIIHLLQETDVTETNSVARKTRLHVFLFLFACVGIGLACSYMSNYQHLKFLRSWGALLVPIFLLFVFFFYQALGQFWIAAIRRFPNWYYQKYRTVHLRQFSKQAEKNAITLAVLSLCITLALTLLVFSGSAYTSMNKEIQRYSPYDMTVNLYRGQGFHYAGETVKERLTTEGFDFHVIKEEYEYPTYTSNLLYKDIIDTSHLWQHDKTLPESKVPILKVSDYNRLMKLQGKKELILADDAFAVNANYKGTLQQIQTFLFQTEELQVGSYRLRRAFVKPLDAVYFLSSVSTNDTGTLILPDKVAETLQEESRSYVALYKEKTDKRKVEAFLSAWIEKHYFTLNGEEMNDFTYQTKVRLAELYLGVMGVIVFVLIFVGIIFLILSFGILSLQSSTSTLESKQDYRILYLLGSRQNEEKRILLQQILTYFALPFLVAIPLSLSLTKSLLGYFANFANTVIVLDIQYLALAIVLFLFYLAVTYRLSWRMLKR